MKTIAFALLILMTTTNSLADRIEHFAYTACYMDVPVREKPTADAKQINTLPKGAKIRVSEQEKHWVKIVYEIPDDPDRRYIIGWCSKHALCPAE